MTIDIVSMPFVKELLDDSRPFVLFVHLMGSHFNVQDRVPASFRTEAGVDAYDRSLRYSDHVIAEIVRLLPPRTELFYISDHGESTDRPGWRDMTSEALWSVPFFTYPAEAARNVRSVADFTSLWYNLIQHDD